MGQIQVVLVDPQGKPMGVELPDDDTVRSMLPALIGALGWGEGCALYNRTQHFWYEETDTLALRNTREGDNLRLMPREG